jgi:nitrogen regulatory protein P-II 1
VKLEVVLEDSLVERAVEAIEQAARTGRIGDGKIFVSAIEEAIRIRTGETGAEAV